MRKKSNGNGRIWEIRQGKGEEENKEGKNVGKRWKEKKREIEKKVGSVRVEPVPGLKQRVRERETL